MPIPTNNEEFFKEWHSFRLEMGNHIVKSELKQEQNEKDIQELKEESEKNKKFRHKTVAVGATLGSGGIVTAIKAFFGGLFS